MKIYAKSTRKWKYDKKTCASAIAEGEREKGRRWNFNRQQQQQQE